MSKKNTTKLPTPLSNINNCVLYNIFSLNHSELAAKDLLLLQDFRKHSRFNEVLNYYARAQRIVRGVNSRSDSIWIWHSLYEDFAKDLLDHLRNDRKDQAMQQVAGLLQHTEKYFLNAET